MTASQGHSPPGWSCRLEVEGAPTCPLSNAASQRGSPEGSRGCSCASPAWRPARVQQCARGSLASSAAAAAADPVLSVLLIRVTVACFLWPLRPAHTTLGPRTQPLLGFRSSGRGRECVPAVGHQDTPPLPFSVHLLQWPFSSCAHRPMHRGDKVRVQGCLTWMWPPTRVNNYRITSIFIAFLLR